jgi:hypothetical protein
MSSDFFRNLFQLFLKNSLTLSLKKVKFPLMKIAKQIKLGFSLLSIILGKTRQNFYFYGSKRESSVSNSIVQLNIILDKLDLDICETTC